MSGMRLIFFLGNVALIACMAARAAEPSHAVVPGWPALPERHVLGLCAGVGVDSHNRVHVFHRSGREWSTPFPRDPIAAPAVSVIDGATGNLLGSWGAGLFIMPHGLTLDREDNVWLTDVGLHQVFKFTPDGRLLLALGERGVPGSDHSHFNLPTDVAVLPDGSFYVSDGYKNTRIVKFAADGRYEFEWGGKGGGPGQFNLPHGIAADARGRLYVCDRSNSRIQVFDAQGGFIDEWKGPHIGRPYGVSVGNDGHIFIIDGGDPSSSKPERGKAVELDADGRVVDTFGSPGSGPGQFQLGHDIAIGPDGAVYVAEGSGRRVQKFVRKPARPLRVFIRAGPKTHGAGEHNYPKFLADWTNLLTERGAVASGALSFPDDSQLAKTDVIVIHAPDGGTMSAAERTALQVYTNRGGGIVVLHDGMCGNDAAWLRTIIGGAKQHGEPNWTRGKFRFSIKIAQHPITRDVADFELDDEIFHHLRVMPGMVTLATVAHEGEAVPQLWCYEPKGGGYRAFVSLQGHYERTFSIAPFRGLVLRGIAWAGKRDADLLVRPGDLAPVTR